MVKYEITYAYDYEITRAYNLLWLWDEVIKNGIKNVTHEVSLMCFM